jgi:hypothetical protein
LAGDLVIFMHGDLFHRACWRIIASNIRIGESRLLKQTSRQLIEDARKQLKGAQKRLKGRKPQT